MGPDSAEHLEILEEFGAGAAPAPLCSTAHTCGQRSQLEGRGRRVCVCVRWPAAAAAACPRLFTLKIARGSELERFAKSVEFISRVRGEKSRQSLESDFLAAQINMLLRLDPPSVHTCTVYYNKIINSRKNKKEKQAGSIVIQSFCSLKWISAE